MRRAKQVEHAIMLLFCLRYLPVKGKSSPSYCHHFCFPFVNYSILYENQWILACGKYWCVRIENHILCEM